LTLILGLVLAGLSAAASNVGFLLRERGATAAPDVNVRRPLRSAIDLFKQRWWTIGYIVAAVAYGLHVAALTFAGLSLVQAVLAGGIVLLGVIAERFFGFSVTKRQWIGMALAAAGLALLAVTGESSSGQKSANYSLAAMIAFEAALVGIGTALILACQSDKTKSQRGVLLAVVAGLLFTVTHVAVKAMTGKIDQNVLELVINPYLLLAILGGIVAFFASARSLQLGPAVAVIAVTSIAGNASSFPAGIIVFGDPLGSNTFEALLRSFAFLLVIGAAALIPAPTRAAEIEGDGEDEESAPEPEPTPPAGAPQPA